MKQNISIQLKPISITTIILLSLGLLMVAITFYVLYRYSAESSFFSISILTLFAGVLAESFRVGRNWLNVVGYFFLSYFASFLSFIPGKRERDYNLQSHIELWPYYFLFIYVLIFSIANRKKLTANITEGITLLLSISLIYWTIDAGFTNFYNLFIVLLWIFVAVFTFRSFRNAFSHRELTPNKRIGLSVWSSVIILCFSVDNIIRVFSNDAIELISSFDQILYVGLDYFLLGISALYIANNFLLLINFFPNKSEKYSETLKTARKNHLARFSNQQVAPIYSLLCVAYSVSLFVVNFYWHLLPRLTMIWLVIFSFPILLHLLMTLQIFKNVNK